MNEPLNVVDLFCGTGGFSVGATAAGLHVVKALDIDPTLTSSYNANFGGEHLHLTDIADLSGNALKRAAGKDIHGLIGGPPCQGFSLIGRRDSEDPRRALVDHFFRLVAEVRPLFFVMENVVGLMQGDARTVLDDAMCRLPGGYNTIGPVVVAASDYGVPTSRQRLFVVGVLTDYADEIGLTPPPDIDAVTVRDAISDLAGAEEVGVDKDGFDVFRLSEQDVAGYAKALRSEDRLFTGNRRTIHTRNVVDRFKTVEQGKTDKVGRHQRLSWDGVCPTLRAGTGSDKGSYQSVRPIHPTEPRVITVREAARLQGFPDSHRFHPTIWHSFRMIGNSVPPPVARVILGRVIQTCVDVKERRPLTSAA